MEHDDTAQFLSRFTQTWNDDDREGYLALFDPAVEFVASPEWPESATIHGREGIAQFVEDFRATWDEVYLELIENRMSSDSVAARCAWVTRGRVSGMEGRLEFAVAMWLREGMVQRGQFFDQYTQALEATGL